MSYSPYYNEPNMHQPRVKGQFAVHSGGVFEYSARPDGDRAGMWPEYPQRIFTLDGDRAARVGKTVVYVIVDESPDGSPVVEKWTLRRHRVFATRAA